MSEDSVCAFTKPDEVWDPLTELLRRGARQLIYDAIEAELGGFLAEHDELCDSQGRRGIVRNGYLPEREVQTGVGPVTVRMPKVRDRTGQGIQFRSALLPPYLRRTKSVEELIPWLYLKGVSTGDFQEALASLLGSTAQGLSPGTISRLKTKWESEHQSWCQRDLSSRRYVYIWADGVYFNVRADDARQCILVVIGVDEHGFKELLAVNDGVRESEQSWLELLRDLKARGLNADPKLAIADGALGFWNALNKVFETTRQQRCWVHKTANLLNKLPKHLQGQAKADIQAIWMAATRAQALSAYKSFCAIHRDKYPKVVASLEKDRDALLAFYDFPAVHWAHIRTTNPIESTFATVRLRTNKTRGCVSRKTILALVHRLALSAQKRWRRLRGFRALGQVIANVPFIDGVRAPSESNASGVAA